MSDIVSTKYRRGTGTRVTYPTLPSLTVQPRRIDIYQKQYSHDVVVLQYPAESTLWFESLHTGVPISFSWNQDTLSKNWIGYVVSVSKQNSPQRLNSMEVMCVSGTFPLKERVTRVFTETTIPAAVKIIANEYGFNFIGDQHKQVFSQLAITGVSYWEWICEQAQRIGYGVIIDGMNFFFRPLDKLIDEGFSSAAILSMGNATAPFNTQFMDRTLDSFKVNSGDNVEDTVNYRAIKNVGGVDPLKARSIISSSTPASVGTNLRTSTSDVLFSEYRTDRVINDDDAAAAAAEGAAQMARFNLPARVQCQGDPRIRPFGTVYISGTGNLTDGFWVVREAHHMFHKIGDYQMDLKISTDGVGATVETPFRSRTDITSGSINLDSVVNNGGIPPLFFEMTSVELTGNTVVKEGNQGFLKNPNKWKYVGAQYER